MRIFTIIILLIPILLLGTIFKSDTLDNQLGRYVQVKVYLNSSSDIGSLLNAGISADEYFGNPKTGIILEISKEEYYKLISTGFKFDILQPDMDAFYNNRLPSSKEELQNSERIMKSDGINGYTLGTMGGYHKYTEIISVLDTLRLLYPNLISAKQSIGNTFENRTLYVVKISDNPDVNESATEPGIYFDGIHHAREPMSMEVQLYYMWYLLENYSTNTEVKNLVDNREIFFVPIVNADGYVYNQTTNPNGGGDWRKTRRPNGGSCYGIDPNRNYSYGWGYNSGSSNDPCSDTYRGTAPNSEPETQAVKSFLDSRHPKIGISLHSAAGYNLNPYSFNDTVVAFDIYSDFSSEFGETNQFLYGTVMEMLAYYSSGTTRDYMHSTGCYGWTSEMEGSNFWPSSSSIIPMCSRFLPTLKLVTYFGGSYAKMQNFSVMGKGWAAKSDTLLLSLTIRNKGLGSTSKNVVVDLSTNYSGITSLVSSVNYDSIQSRQSKINSSTPFKFIIPNSAVIGDNIRFIASVKQEGAEVSRDTFYVTIGKVIPIFSDNAENGLINFTSSSNKLQWDTTYVSNWSGNKSFADSRYGNSKDATNSYLTLNNPLSLSNTINPRLEYAIKFATEPGYDYIRTQITTNNGTTWTNLTGRYTKLLSSQPSYVGVKYWVYEQINLSAYIGQSVKFRFYLYTDSGTPGDGVYIDNIRLVDYKDGATNITLNNNEIPGRFELFQNYPNPFNPVTKIKFSLPYNNFASIKIFDVLGRIVATPVNQFMNAGNYSIDFDGSELSSGIYYYKIESGNFNDVKIMVLQK